MGLLSIGLRNPAAFAPAVAAVVLGMGALINGLWRQRTRVPTPKWQRATGRVEVAWMAHGSDLAGPSNASWWGPSVRFTYAVGEQVYRKRFFPRKSEGIKTALDLEASYPAGRNVEVRYDPEHPERAVVAGHEDRHADTLIGTGVILLAAGVWWTASAFLS